jgi:hypothetical protein
MSTTTNLVLAGLGAGGAFLLGRKLLDHKSERLATEHARTCARACAPATPPRTARTSRHLSNASTGLSPRTFDQIFAAYGHGIPVPFLRALALRESDMRASLADGPAWGLLQVIEIVRQDYNKKTGATYTRQDLLNPIVNVSIASAALVTIVESYARNHPHVSNLQPNWQNPRFVELLTFGWNAGWSEGGGVGRVATYLEQRGRFDLTIDTIFQAAADAGASPHLANPAKVAWSKSVVAQYLRELATDQQLHGAPHEPVEIEMPDDYVGHPVIVATGPITHPSQLPSSGPQNRPAHASTPDSAPAAPAHAETVSPSPPAVTVVAPAAPQPPSQSPSGLGGPVNPYPDDCACKA